MPSLPFEARKAKLRVGSMQNPRSKTPGNGNEKVYSPSGYVHLQLEKGPSTLTHVHGNCGERERERDRQTETETETERERERERMNE